MVTCIIFDLDGVLIDLCDTHKECFQKALFVAAGIKIDDEYHNKFLNGLPTKVKLTKLGIFPKYAEKVLELKQQYTLEALKDIKKDEELSNILWELSLYFNLYCASNSLHETVKLTLEKLGIISYFEEIYGNDSVLWSKPSPEMYYRCMVDCGAKTKETLAIEDSSIGEATIKNAGCHGLIIKNRAELTLERINKKIEEIENEK